jgi:hypothetical protein
MGLGLGAIPPLIRKSQRKSVVSGPAGTGAVVRRTLPKRPSRYVSLPMS